MTTKNYWLAGNWDYKKTYNEGYIIGFEEGYKLGYQTGLAKAPMSDVVPIPRIEDAPF